MDEYTRNFWERMGKLEEKLAQGEDPFGFTDEQARRLIDRHNRALPHMKDVQDTQAGIIKYAEAMAEVLAEAAIASQKAVGDAPSVALSKWMKVIRTRAEELIREKQSGAKKIGKGTVIDV